MTTKIYEYYDCAEAEENELLVCEYPNKIYFDAMNDENGGVFLNRDNVQKLVLRLNGWLEKTKTKGANSHEEKI